jgi:syntaxin 1B/2/3
MIELAELFQDLDVLVMEQETQVKLIEEKGEEVQQDLEKANVELDLGVKSARGARKKKWICLFLTIFILIAIAVAVAVYILITKKAAKTAGVPV